MGQGASTFPIWIFLRGDFGNSRNLGKYPVPLSRKFILGYGVKISLHNSHFNVTYFSRYLVSLHAAFSHILS